MSSLTRHRRRTDEQRVARAEAKAFQPGINGRDSPRNWKSQLLLALAFGATFVGGWLALVGSYLGLGLLVVGLPTTVASGVWIIRHWDY